MPITLAKKKARIKLGHPEVFNKARIRYEANSNFPDKIAMVNYKVIQYVLS